ncbi:MAG: hypothetical protein JWR59_2242 [Brevundimonas sp.]|nr:hypothetical protein [Brevundimonas sp.]
MLNAGCFRNRLSGRPLTRELGLHETVLRRWMTQFGMQATGTSRRPTTQASSPSPSDLAAEKPRSSSERPPDGVRVRRWASSGLAGSRDVRGPGPLAQGLLRLARSAREPAVCRGSPRVTASTQPETRPGEICSDTSRASTIPAACTAARSRVNAAKIGLGERGPVWWADGSPDLNRHLARTTAYAAWFASLGANASS